MNNELTEDKIKKLIKTRNKYLVKCFLILNDRLYLSLSIVILIFISLFGAFLHDDTYVKNIIEFIVSKLSTLILGLFALSTIIFKYKNQSEIIFPIFIDVFKDSGAKKQIKIFKIISEKQIEKNLFEQVLEINGTCEDLQMHDIAGYAMYHPVYGCKCLIIKEIKPSSNNNIETIIIRFDKNNNIRIHTIE